MKICYFYDYLGDGGSEKYGIRLAENMEKNGHRSIIAYNNSRPEILKNIDIEKAHLENRGTLDVKAVIDLKKFITTNQIDIIHVAYPREEVLAVLAKWFGAEVKVIRTYHRMDRFVFKSWLMEKTIGRGVSAYIAPTEFAATKMIGGGVSRKKISVIPNGVASILTSKHEKAVGFIGRIEHEKGILKTAEFWPADAPRLLIAGEGSDLEKINNLGKKNIETLGQVDSLGEFFGKISVLILPSVNETLPLSILEAYSAGVPVVTFDIPALRGVVDSSTGAAVTAGDFGKLINMAISLANDPKIGKLSISARGKFLQKYDENITTKAVANLYQGAPG